MTTIKRVTVKAILDAVNCPHLSLHKDGSYVLVYEDATRGISEKVRLTGFMRLDKMELAEWVTWAQQIIKSLEKDYADSLKPKETIRIGNPKGRHLYDVEVTNAEGKTFKIEVTAHDRRIAETAAIKAGYAVRSINMVG